MNALKECRIGSLIEQLTSTLFHVSKYVNMNSSSVNHYIMFVNDLLMKVIIVLPIYQYASHYEEKETLSNNYDLVSHNNILSQNEILSKHQENVLSLIVAVRTQKRFYCSVSLLNGSSCESSDDF